MLATADDVLKSLDKKEIAILDTRSDGEYFGTHVRAARGGSIPGSIHIEWTDNIAADGKFKSNRRAESDVRAKSESPRIRKSISYCQGGYRAAHSYVALRLIGFPKFATIIGSWKEWGDRTDLPIEIPKSAK